MVSYGRVSVLVGTHTHTPTANAKILPRSTAYITDVGMSGPYDSVIGMNKEQAIHRFLKQTPHKYETATMTFTFALSWSRWKWRRAEPCG